MMNNSKLTDMMEGYFICKVIRYKFTTENQFKFKNKTRKFEVNC